MKLIIDIPEEDYIIIKNAINGLIENGVERASVSQVCLSILNGTPLPKHHGRLIDEEDIALIDEQFYVPSDYYVAESAINDAPTIIEADKESESE